MAFHINHFSKNLIGYTDVNIYLPIGTEYEDELDPNEKFQVLWLLHGHSGNFSEWSRYSAIEKLAMDHGFAVVMPCGANSSYNDMPTGMKYYTYITEELPAFLRRRFPLSDKREDNFIAGLSMGGIGAAKLGFANPDKYSAIGIFSGGPDDPLTSDHFRSDNPVRAREVACTFFPTDFEPGKPNDIWGNFLKLKDSGYPMPLIYDICGSEDFVYPSFERFKTFAEESGMAEYVNFETCEGVHNFDVWDYAVHRFVEQLPLKNRGIWRRWYDSVH